MQQESPTLPLGHHRAQANQQEEPSERLEAAGHGKQHGKRKL
jgi:hypothetical protein